MQVDIALKGGLVIDPREGIRDIADIYIKNQRIVAVPREEKVEADCTVNVQGCLVVPGLIDFHTHVYDKGTDSGITDAIFPSMGVTTIVDGGSAGTANFEAFYRDVVVRSNIRIKSLLNVSPTGIITRKFHENVDPSRFDELKIRRVFEKYRHNIIGLKVRGSRDIVGNMGVMPVQETVNLAQQLGCPVVVHATDPGVATSELAKALRKGDVFCHVYHGVGSTIIGSDGGILDDVQVARHRGVVFDAANGQANYAHKTARAALAAGFLPDVISTDAATLNAFRGRAFALPYVMSKYINMGVDLVEVIRACTATPANLMGMDGQIGTLAPGAFADVTVLKLKVKRIEFTDFFNETLIGYQVLVPQITICDGAILFRQMDI